MTSIPLFVYGKNLHNSAIHEARQFITEDTGCIAALIINRALSKSEFEDVRKLAAELCGRLQPEVRGNNAYTHPDLLRIRQTIATVLSWVSTDGDEISKAQHGCIDSLALMLCTELQAPDSSKGTLISSDSIPAYVINHLTESNGARLTFRLCMAHVLISACQKKSYAKKITPRIIRSVKVMADTAMRAACIQVLFTVAYRLKSSILKRPSEHRHLLS